MSASARETVLALADRARHRALAWIVRAVVLAGAVRLVMAIAAFPQDDAYIHLRIARNLAFHGEPYFNLGEPVLATSSPLWTLLVAALFRLGGYAEERWVTWLAAAVFVSLVLAAERFLTAVAPRPSKSLVPFLSAAALSGLLVLPASGSLMDPPLALLLLVGGAALLARNRSLAAGVVLALGATARFELGLAVAAALILTRGRERLRLAMGSAPILAVYGLLLWLAFGTLRPHSMVAKALVYRPSWEEFWSAVPGPASGRPVGFLLPLAAFALACGLAIVRMRSPRVDTTLGTPPALALLAGFGGSLLAIYLACRTNVFEWYWPMALLPGALALSGLALDRSEDRRKAPRLALAGLLVVALATFAVDTIDLASAVARNRFGDAPSLRQSMRTVAYRDIGTWIERSRPGAVVMAAEIGALGWAYPGRIIDGVGLASPEVLPYLPLRVPEERYSGTVGALSGRAVAALQPDVVVAMDIFASDFLAKAQTMTELRGYALVRVRPVFDADLREAYGLPAELWGGREIGVWGRGQVFTRALFPNRQRQRKT